MRCPSVGVLSRQGQAPIPTAVQWLPGGGAGGWNSAFGGVGAFFDAPPARTAADVQDNLWDIPNLQSITAGSTYLVPPGEGFLTVSNAAVVLELQVGTVGTWVALPAGNGYNSDGYNVRLHNTGASTYTATLYPMR